MQNENSHLDDLALTGCASAADLGAPGATGPDPVGFPECRSESYDFVGRGTLAGLKLGLLRPMAVLGTGAPAKMGVGGTTPDGGTR